MGTLPEQHSRYSSWPCRWILTITSGSWYQIQDTFRSPRNHIFDRDHVCGHFWCKRLGNLWGLRAWAPTFFAKDCKTFPKSNTKFDKNGAPEGPAGIGWASKIGKEAYKKAPNNGCRDNVVKNYQKVPKMISKWRQIYNISCFLDEDDNWKTIGFYCRKHNYGYATRFQR